MTPITSREDAIKLFDKLLQERIPEIIRTANSNFREGIIINFDSVYASVEIVGTRDIKSLKIPRGVTGITVGDRCLLIALDPRLSGKIFIVSIYKA